MDLKNKKVVVLGAGRSGIVSALFLKKRGAEVLISEKKAAEVWLNDKKKLENNGIEIEAGGHTNKILEKTDLIIVSPGIPLGIPILKQANALNVPVISEIELAFSFCPVDILAIGGTNGKTTTTTLLGEIFKNAKIPVIVAGNIGTPFIGEIEKITSRHVVILEISSFQLETIKNFRPKISITLNLTQDHLDRYSSMEEYSLAKQRIFLNQTEDDWVVLNFDDSGVSSWAKKAKAKVVFFSTEKYLSEGACLEGSDIVFSWNNKKEKLFSINEIKLLGGHNVSNILAAVSAAKLYGISSDAIKRTVPSFKGLEHRIEFVREIDGVQYYNDSKGTTVDSVVKALESFNAPVILIAGGQDKNSDFSVLRPFIKSKVRSLILIGEAKKKIRGAAGDLVETSESDNLESAVIYAKRKAETGDIVLLSPGCTSFDMFKDYEERGNRFKEIVRSL